MTRPRIWRHSLLAFAALPLLTLFAGPLAFAVSLEKYPQLIELTERLSSRHGLDRERMNDWLGEAKIKPKIIEAMERPAEQLPWHRYQALFVNNASINRGVQFIKTHAGTLARAEAQYGVPVEIITAIIGIETRYGTVTGSLRVLDSLVTLSMEYPRRSKFFLSELEHYLLLVARQGLDPLVVKGSYAGAIGVPQFMPSSYRRFAVDFDNDGKADLINSVADAIGSVANYLGEHRWHPGEPIVTRLTDSAATVLDPYVTRKLKANTPVATVSAAGVSLAEGIALDASVGVMRFDGALGKDHRLGYHNFFVITRYNRSQNYAMSVFELAERISRALGS